MSTEPRPELDKAFEEIRREVIESRNLVIKTDNLLKNLHAELKLVSKRQEDFQRRQWVSSGVAYAAFVGLAVAGALGVANARAGAATQERERLEKQVQELSGQVEKQRVEAQALLVNERGAAEVYRLMTAGAGEERLKGVDALARLDLSKLSPFLARVLQDRAVALRKEVGATALERGKTAFRRQEWSAAAEELKRVLALSPAEEDALEASYYLGNALVQLRKNEDAIPHLVRFVEGDKRAKTRDFAMLLLVQAYDATGQRDKAVEVARDGAAAYGAGEFGASFRNRLLRRGDAPQGASPQGGTPAPAPAPAAPAGQGGAGPR